MLGLHLVPLKMRRGVVWSGMRPLTFHSFEGDNGPVQLGGRVREQGQSMIHRYPRRCLHHR